MNKFLKKKSTLISFIVAAVVVLVLLVAFCVRPVSVGYTYSGENYSMHFKNFDQYVETTKVFNSNVETEGYYFTNESVLVTSSLLDNEGFKTYKEEALENWETFSQLSSYKKINAFQIVLGDEVVATCTGGYITVAVLAVVELVLLAFVGMAVSAGKKKKSKKK